MHEPPFYDVLEVSPKASPEVIRAAYKSLMQRHHPDKVPDGTTGPGHAALISQAYEVLSDPQKRAAYDLRLQSAAPVAMTPDAAPAVSIAPRRVRVAAQPAKSKQLQLGYAWFLIACIVVAGGILVLWPSRSVPPPPMPGAVAGVSALAGGNTARVPESAVSQAQTSDVAAPQPVAQLNGFVSDLTVALVPSVAGAPAHALHIPALGFRITGQDAGRWAQRLETDRAKVMYQLISELGRASYQDLAKADGDLYLKRFIESTVSTVAGLDAEPPNADGTLQKPLEALLPRGYTLN